MASENDPIEKPAKTTAEIESDPKGIVRRWLAEMMLADRAEEDWRKEASTVLDVYDCEKRDASSFDILYSNTETLEPAVYNSTPKPDVRRRFRDDDKMGKAASTVLKRALSYEIDDYDFDTEMKDVVLDVLLPGRGVARINYEPHFVKVTPDGMQPGLPGGAMPVEMLSGPGAAGENPAALSMPSESAEPAAPVTGSTGEAPEQPNEAPQPYEKLAGQSAQCSHVQWDKFRRGPAKRWKDVPWVSFEHDFTYEMAVEKFGEDIANALKYEDTDGSDQIKGAGRSDKELRTCFQVCKVYEIWDKPLRRVLFVAPCYKARPCAIIPDPLKLRQFFPLPRPVYAVRSTSSLVPRPLYRFYEEQARELDLVSARINKIVKALKVRGAYASHIQEAVDILDSDDNGMTAITNLQAISEAGGLDKLIWILPVEKLAGVLDYLYKARDQIKQTIYEISGIADVIRGSTNPNETLGAQQLKSQWGSLRLQKVQREVQRFIRDLMRLKAEIIAEHFEPEHLAMMTNIKLPTGKEKAAVQQRVQSEMMKAQQTGQPPPPMPPEMQEVLDTPTWDEVMQLMRSDQMRQYRIDIETDSTIQETIMQDMQGLGEVVQQVAQILQGVAQGLPMDVAKKIAMAVCRHARFGNEVEDALEALQQPPAPQGEAPPPDHSREVAEIKARSSVEIEQLRQTNAKEIEQIKQENANLREEMKQSRVDAKSQLDNAVKVIVAAISATKGAATDASTSSNANREFSEGVTS